MNNPINTQAENESQLQVADTPASSSNATPAGTPREKPILFSAPMVRAILEGKKTQTRRVITTFAFDVRYEKQFFAGVDAEINGANTTNCHFSLFGSNPATATWERGKQIAQKRSYRVGDRLWVRETFAVITGEGTEPNADDAVEYRADESEAGKALTEIKAWRPSIYMPRVYSRITLEITEIRVQRLHDISKPDVIAEGITEREGYPITDCHAGWHEPFAHLWDSINGKKHPWSSNPWVWAITFKNVSLDTPASE